MENPRWLLLRVALCLCFIWVALGAGDVEDETRYVGCFFYCSLTYNSTMMTLPASTLGNRSEDFHDLFGVTQPHTLATITLDLNLLPVSATLGQQGVAIDESRVAPRCCLCGLHTPKLHQLAMFPHNQHTCVLAY